MADKFLLVLSPELIFVMPMASGAAGWDYPYLCCGGITLGHGV